VFFYNVITTEISTFYCFFEKGLGSLMSSHFITDSNFKEFVGKLIETKNLIGPTAKKNKFVFKELKSFDDLRLDYDVTILPPKKLFFPPRQDLLKFHGQKPTSCIDPVNQILLGVHFYDIKGIDTSDTFYGQNLPDNAYMANRDCTTLIGSNIQKVSPRAFFASVGKEVEAKGHDGFLTKITNGYLYEVKTVKGKELLASGSFVDANQGQIDEALKVNSDALTMCKETLTHSTTEIAEKVRNSFENKVWEKISEDCFSCGSCNIVCPTCYCFDVQDNWNMDQNSGVRTRTWDGCLKADFSEVSLGQGACENFRGTRASRYRHRIMRKATYLNATFGGPACVGCGRCSVSCTADIADPCKLINEIMEG
jgi:ferredoxin